METGWHRVGIGSRVNLHPEQQQAHERAKGSTTGTAIFKGRAEEETMTETGQLKERARTEWAPEPRPEGHPGELLLGLAPQRASVRSRPQGPTARGTSNPSVSQRDLKF